MRPLRLVALALLPLAAACGESLGARVERAMDGCVAQRNPMFMGGKGNEAIRTPLPADLEKLATRFNYPYAFKSFRAVAEQAATQAILTCALEFASRYHDKESRAFVEQYVSHPSLDVAAAARGLVAKY